MGEEAKDVVLSSQMVKLDGVRSTKDSAFQVSEYSQLKRSLHQPDEKGNLKQIRQCRKEVPMYSIPSIGPAAIRISLTVVIESETAISLANGLELLTEPIVLKHAKVKIIAR